MRMRKLGKGQSVIFCVTEEIRSKIHDHTSTHRDAGVSVADVLRWAISETYTEIRQSIPLWAEQGLHFVRHERLWGSICTAGLANISGKQAGEFLQAEAQSLESRYRPHLQPDTAVETTRTTSNDTKAAHIWQRCKNFQELSFRGTRIQEDKSVSFLRKCNKNDKFRDRHLHSLRSIVLIPMSSDLCQLVLLMMDRRLT